MSSAKSGVVTCQQRVCPFTSIPFPRAQSTILSHGRKSYTPWLKSYARVQHKRNAAQSIYDFS